LGGFRFRVNDREVEFGRGYVKGGYEFYAEMRFPTRDEAERFASSLKAVGVDARVVDNVVRLDSDAFFGLPAAANAAPPGLKPLYRSKKDNFRVYAAREDKRMRLYFAVKHEGARRAFEGLYKKRNVDILRKEREVLEAVRDAVAKALKAEVGEPTEIRDEEGNIKVYHLLLYGPHLKPFLEHAAERVEAQPAEVRLEGRRIVISAGDVKAEVEFKLLKHREVEFLLAKDVRETLALYKSLKEVGVPVEITPEGVRVGSEALWGLVAAAVERALSALPAEVMPGVELLKVYDVGEARMYAFRAEGVHYYFAVKTEKEWRAAGGKYDGTQVQIKGKAAHAVAEAINALYREMDVERRVEVKYGKDGAPYIYLTNVDLRLLGLGGGRARR